MAERCRAEWWTADKGLTRLDYRWALLDGMDKEINEDRIGTVACLRGQRTTIRDESTREWRCRRETTDRDRI